MRDIKKLTSFAEQTSKIKEMNLFKNLKKDVIAGANGTLDYVFKKGIKNIRTKLTRQSISK